MKKYIFLSIITFLLSSCFTLNNKKFYNYSVDNEIFSLCYIVSDPKIIPIDSLDTIDANYVNKILNNERIHKISEYYELIVLNVITVDLYFTKSAYNSFVKARKAMGLSLMKSRTSFGHVDNVIYFLHNKKYDYLKSFKRNYDQKTLTILNQAYYYPKNDSVKITYSFKTFNHNKYLKYDNLIRLE